MQAVYSPLPCHFIALYGSKVSCAQCRAYHWAYHKMQDVNKSVYLIHLSTILLYLSVAPHAVAWIEILSHAGGVQPVIVAPHAGAWIEMLHNVDAPTSTLTSLPTRERGLKYVGVGH